MTNLQKIVVLCVVGATIIGGGFFLLKDYNYEKPQGELRVSDEESDDVDVIIQFDEGGINNNGPPIVIVDEPESSGFGVGNDPPIVDLSSWQTYRNEEFGFEVKYPEGWVIEEKEDNFGRFTLSLIDPETAHSPGYEFDVWILADPVGFAERGNYASLIDYLENSGVTNIISYDTIGAENESAILATTAGLGYTLGYHIEQSDNSVYEIVFSTNQHHYNRDLEIFEINATANQILSTFKFIE